MLNSILQQRGYIETDLGAGEHAMIKAFPCGISVWVSDDQGGVQFPADSIFVHIGVYQHGAPMEDVEVTHRDSFNEAIGRIEIAAYQTGVKILSQDAVVEEAFNEAVGIIQQKLGVKDGGFASVYFSGPREDQLKKLLSDYLRAELQMGKPEGLENLRQSEELITLARGEKLKSKRKKKLHKTDFGTYAFVAFGTEITGFLTGENSIECYHPDIAESEQIPLSYGFEVITAASGCSAWQQTFTLSEKAVVMLITDIGGATHKVAPDQNLLVGLYTVSDGEIIAVWQQANFPLGADDHVVFHSSEG